MGCTYPAGFDPAEALKAVTRQHAEMRAIRNGPENQKYGAVSIVRVFPNGGTQAKCGVQVYQLRQLATDLAEICLSQAHVHKVQVRVEKPDVIPYVGSVGVEIERSN